MNTFIRLEATGDNGYRCPCCRNTWDIEEDFDTEQKLINYCIEAKRGAERFGDGFTVNSIHFIEAGDDYETKRTHPNEAKIIQQIDGTIKIQDEEAKQAEELEAKRKLQESYAAELANMEERRKFLEAQLNQTN